jgi:dsRNA-specific ribonuclease
MSHNIKIHTRLDVIVVSKEKIEWLEQNSNVISNKLVAGSMNYKGKLQELFQDEGKDLPTYHTYKIPGGLFKSEVSYNEVKKMGIDISKKGAEQNAALNLFNALVNQ